MESAPGHEKEFPKGAIAMTAVGGMGINFDGEYVEYTCVPVGNVQLVKSSAESLGWEVLGALLEMLQRAHGYLFRNLKLEAGDTLLIRGGTTSVELAASAIAKKACATVRSTTRKTDPETAQLRRDNGADHVIVSNEDSLKSSVLQICPPGGNKILELVGGSTLADSLSCLAMNGICCLVGLVGGSVTVPEFNPLAMIQTGRYVTAYGERTFSAANLPLDDLIKQIQDKTLTVRVGKVFTMDQIVEAHECMENNEPNGKIVVLTGM